MDEKQQYGVVIVFAAHVTEEQAESVLKFLETSYLIDVRNSTNLHSFNPQYGGPVWYIP